MLKCPKCKIQTSKGEPTGKFLTKVRVLYPNNVVGSRIVKEVKCCLKCSGEEYLEETETSRELIEFNKRAEANVIVGVIANA